MTEHIPEICAAFEIWQDNDCIGAGTTLELIMRYLADDPQIDYQVTNVDLDTVVQDYISLQNERLNAKTLIIRELNNQIAKLKTEHLIDENCVDEECVGCCKVVDVAAKLQEELDECSNTNSALHEDIEGLKADYGIMRTNHLNTINKLKDDLVVKDRTHTLDMETIQELWGVIHDFREGYGASRLFVDAVLIRNLKGDNEKLKTTIDDLNSQLTEKQAIINEITRLRVKEVETRQALEAELSARKEDSAVLIKVVEIIKEHEVATADLSSYTRQANTVALNRISTAVEDYLDAPEGPPETPIDDLYRVSVFLEMP